jgi:L-aminopeptidase/D-esterase-like protein
MEIEVRDGWAAGIGAAVGHAQVPGARTGCTVVVLPGASPYAALSAGGATSSRQVAALQRDHSVTVADAFLVAGGSAFGLDATGGALRWLERRGRGTRVGSMRVPAVPSVAVFDLPLNPDGSRPGVAEGEAACEAARPDVVPEGRVGAGSGTTVGKVLGLAHAMWGGVGAATVVVPGGPTVSALVVVNAFGNVCDPASGACVAGARDPSGGFADAEALLMGGLMGAHLRSMAGNTTVALVVTDGRLDAAGCLRASVLAAQALPLCVRPCQTAVDGDTVLLASVGDKEADAHQVGLAARHAVVRAVLRAVRLANPPGGDFPGGTTA